MTTQTVDGSGIRPRTAAQTLVLLAAPPHQCILRSLASGPKRLVELRRESGSLTQKALRSCLRTLEQIRAVAKHRRKAIPGSLEYELSEQGRELRFVGSVLDRWLAACPRDPLQLGDESARQAILALASGWSSKIMRALASRPRSLDDLHSDIDMLDRPSLESRLEEMRLAGLVEMPAPNEPKPAYAVTDWLRLGLGPIAAASRWERRNMTEQTAAIGKTDVEAGLMLAMPLAQLPIGTSGACRFVVELSGKGENESAIVTVAARDGGIVSCAIGGDVADASATGEPTEWFRAAIEADPGHLTLSGNRRLAHALLQGLYGVLFSRPRRGTFRYL